MGRYDALLQEEKSLPQPSAEQSPPAANAPTISPTELPQDRSEESRPKKPVPSGETQVRPPASPPARTPVRLKRTITRYAFEFFQDQIETLKQFSLEEQLRGEKGSMSQMVREALDTYIAKRKRTED
jgi:hypothetical protein